MAHCYQEIIDYAIDKAIFIAPHNYPPVVEPTGNDLLSFLNQIDRKNVTIILDTSRWPRSHRTNLKVKFDPILEFYPFIEQVSSQGTYVRAKIYKVDKGQ